MFNKRGKTRCILNFRRKDHFSSIHFAIGIGLQPLRCLRSLLIGLHFRNLGPLSFMPWQSSATWFFRVRVLENAIRSCSALIERLHHSTSTYVMISANEYINMLIFFLVAIFAIAALLLITYHFIVDTPDLTVAPKNTVFSTVSSVALCGFATCQYFSIPINYYLQVVICILTSAYLCRKLRMHHHQEMMMDILSCTSLAFTRVWFGILLSWLVFLKCIVLE